MAVINVEKYPFVTIQCAVYNHAPYLRQCLDGFIMQQTNFPFEAVVHDDASTDTSADIIREYADKYPDIIKPIYEKENQYSKHDGSLQKIIDQATQGKYIAVCEGDDYWTDPYKLQKQVNYMENYPECGLVYTSVRYYSQKDQKFTIYFGEERHSIQDFAVKGNGIPTLTVLYKREIAKRYYDDIQPEKQNWAMGDLPMWLYFAQNSNLGFIPECTGVYRVLENSASHFSSQRNLLKFQLNSIEIIKYYLKKYNIPCPTAEINLIWYKFYYYAKIGDLEGLDHIILLLDKSPYKWRSIKLIILELLKYKPHLFLILIDSLRTLRKRR